MIFTFLWSAYQSMLHGGGALFAVNGLAYNKRAIKQALKTIDVWGFLLVAIEGEPMLSFSVPKDKAQWAYQKMIEQGITVESVRAGVGWRSEPQNIVDKIMDKFSF